MLAPAWEDHGHLCSTTDPVYAVSVIFGPGDQFRQILNSCAAAALPLGVDIHWHIGVDPVPTVKICQPSGTEQHQLDTVMQQIGAGQIDLVAAGRRRRFVLRDPRNRASPSHAPLGPVRGAAPLARSRSATGSLSLPGRSPESDAASPTPRNFRLIDGRSQPNEPGPSEERPGSYLLIVTMVGRVIATATPGRSSPRRGHSRRWRRRA